jgi:hypothetical protein
VIRRILGIILLLGVFLGGYHLGRLPGSPDLIGGARNAGRAVYDAGSAVARAVDSVASSFGFSETQSRPDPSAKSAGQAEASSPLPAAPRDD